MRRVSQTAVGPGDLLAEAARRHPTGRAIVGGGRAWTRAEMSARVDGAPA